jgi:hypothetical protein
MAQPFMEDHGIFMGASPRRSRRPGDDLPDA